ncbi:MAG: xanthine dehydrogenase small subunit [Gammaproteobacteria bacterium]|nr:xanthine dehydrogenase small subunit [Gammaproteobacteria bacterium]
MFGKGVDVRAAIRFWFQDDWRTLVPDSPTDLVLPYLREQCRLVGSKEGCNEGDCGACTALLAHLTPDGLQYQPVNTCILPVTALHHCWLLTIEDIGDVDQLHPVQAAVVEANGTQCGFCTPGFVMSLVAGHLEPGLADPLPLLAGNLCRCTGYGGLIEVAKQLSQLPKDPRLTAKIERAEAALRAVAAETHALAVDTPSGRIDAPTDLADLLTQRQQVPDALLVGGATDVGLWITKRLEQPEHMLFTGGCPELRTVQLDETSLRIGAAASYHAFQAALLDEYPELTDWYERLGSVQVRSRGTLGGNFANGSPIGDSPPVWMALGATMTLLSTAGARTIPVEDFFIDYRQTCLAPNELIGWFDLPRRSPGMRVQVDKVSRRWDQDISTVLVACVQRDSTLRIGLGGLAATPRLAHHVMRSRDVADLTKDITPLSDLRASSQYRLQVTQGLIRAFLEAGS